MIPFDGIFAQNTVLPLAKAAYDSTQPPPKFTLNETAFEILAQSDHPNILSLADGPDKANPEDEHAKNF
jgi:hypothetical protein